MTRGMRRCPVRVASSGVILSPLFSFHLPPISPPPPPTMSFRPTLFTFFHSPSPSLRPLARSFRPVGRSFHGPAIPHPPPHHLPPRPRHRGLPHPHRPRPSFPPRPVHERHLRRHRQRPPRRRRVPLPARRQTAPEHRQCLRAQLWRCLRPLCRRVHQEGRKGFGIPPRRRLCLSPGNVFFPLHPPNCQLTPRGKIVPLHQVLYPSRLGQDRRPVRLCLWHQDPYRWLQGPHCRPPLGQARRLFDRRLSAYVPSCTGDYRSKR